jgi:hypothetical protein
MHPDEKPIIMSVGYGNIESEQTNAEIVLSPLTDEVLRDIARNESASKAWQKAAVKFLVDRNSIYVRHPACILMAAEIKEEREAEQEVKAIVESVTETPFNEVESDNTL